MGRGVGTCRYFGAPEHPVRTGRASDTIGPARLFRAVHRPRPGRGEVAMGQIGSEPLRAADYAERARAALSRMAWDYVDGGSGDEHTIAANLRAYDDVRLTNRVLVDVS